MAIQHMGAIAREGWIRLLEMFLGDTRLAEFLSGLLAIGWGLYFLFPQDGTLSSNVARAMSTYAPLAVWGVTILVVGSMQSVGAAFRIKVMRVVSGYVVAPLWIFIAAWSLFSGFRVAGFLAYAAFAGICSWVYIRQAGDGLVWLRHRVADRRGKRDV